MGGRAMGAYLDRLNAQYDEAREGVEAVLDRAADEGREVTESEEALVARDRARMTELTAAIEHYTGLETQAGKVQALRSSVPAPVITRPVVPEADEYDLAREFPTPADYAITLHRAWVHRDPEARERLDRATAHQLTTDNPGIIPRPVLGPVLNLIDTTRPFINSITRKALPAGKFDRPVVTQHVAVGVQATEKTLTESQKMLIGLLPVTAKTYAGHLNISRQDIKWTSPGILNIVFEDFAKIYAVTTCDDATAQFEASVTATAAAGNTGASVKAALFDAMATAMSGGTGIVADTLWMAPDVWAAMGGMTVGTDGAPAFPALAASGAAGTNPGGLSYVVEPHMTAGKAILGPSRLVEWYEDVDGLMQVQEPDVLGQLVGYAGYGAFLNLEPDAFVSLTGITA